MRRRRSGERDDLRNLGVAPSYAALLTHVILPDGDAVDPSDADIDAWGSVVRVAPDTPADAWRTLSIRVTVTVPRCESLEFVWTSATADAEHQLVPLPPRIPR